MIDFSLAAEIDKGTFSNSWRGIVAPREFWDRDDELLQTRAEIENWGYRVKVRIEGIHPSSKIEFPDDQLPWVVVTGTTAGSGHKRTGLSVGITQGSKVWGIWENPVKKEGPILIGTLPNLDHLLLPKKQPVNDGFIPFSGITDVDLTASYSIPLDEGKPLEGYFYPNLASLSDVAMMQEPEFPLQLPQDCEKVPLRQITVFMKELIGKIERAIAQLNTWKNAAQGWIKDKQKWIQDKISEASEFIALALKWLFKEIRKYVEEEINKRAKKLIELVNPPDRDKAKVAHDAIIELIVCLFNKLIAGLKALIGNFLSKMLDRYINVPACAVQNFVGSLLGNLLGALSGAIDSILNRLTALIGGVFDLAGSVLGILSQLAGFFSCDEDQDCPETKEWSIFDGGKPPITFDIQSIINQAKSIAENAAGLVDIDNIASINFDDLISGAVGAANGCNVGPVFCGPPKVTFWGGGGSGAKGNAIISAAGDLLGVDIIAPGLGYTKAPSVDISDSCGKGGGVRTTVNVVPDGGQTSSGQPTFSVSNVVVNDPGSGFIPTPNGDLGGDGRVWAPADWTVVNRGDGRWNRYPPNTSDDVINANPEAGDVVLTPEDRVIRNDDAPLIGPGNNPTPGNYPQGGSDDGGINGRGIGESDENRIARIRGTTKIPGTGPNGETVFDAFPTLDVGTYPVILYLCDVVIENAGINYSADDKIVISPNSGAEVVATFGPFGVLDSVRIINSGRGFTERPEIYIESETGYNAKLVPVFCIDRIGDDTDGFIDDETIYQNVIAVVDCVGNVGENSFAGFVNGEPYYGPFHIYRGRKMVGRTHVSAQQPYIYETINDSIQNYDDRFAWLNGTLVSQSNTRET